jgi:hypothetical protein
MEENREKNNNLDGKKIEFLKFEIEYLEKRIDLVDKKASFLIAILTFYSSIIYYLLSRQGVFEALASFNQNCLISWLFLGLLIFFVFIILLLLQTIRVTKLFSKNLKLDDRDEDENYVMWPTKDYPRSFKRYAKIINNLSSGDIIKNLSKTAHIKLLLIEEKYKRYVLAHLLIKIFILITSLIILFLFIT